MARAGPCWPRSQFGETSQGVFPKPEMSFAQCFLRASFFKVENVLKAISSAVSGSFTLDTLRLSGEWGLFMRVDVRNQRPKQERFGASHKHVPI